MNIQNRIRAKAPLALAVFLAGFGTVSAHADTFLYNDISNGAPAGGLTCDIANPNCEQNDAAGGQETISLSQQRGIVSFGNMINIASGGSAGIATVVLSNYATQASTANLLLNLYAVGSGASAPVTGPNGGPSGNSPTNPPDGISTLTTPDISVGVNFSPTPGTGALQFATFDLGGANLAAGNYVWTLSIADAPSLNWAVNNFTSNIDGVMNPNYDVVYVNGVGQYFPLDGQFGQGELSIASGTPEPGTIGLIGLGLLGVGFSIRKKKSNKA